MGGEESDRRQESLRQSDVICFLRVWVGSVGESNNFSSMTNI